MTSTQSKPAKSHWVDLATKSGEMGREDCQAGWHELFRSLIASTDTVLDVGAGLGLSKERIGAERTTTQDPGPSLPVDTSRPVEFFPSKSFDYVTVFDVIEHIVEDVPFLNELKRIARKGVFITTPNFNVSKAGNGCHCREYTPLDFLVLTAGTGRRLWKGKGDGKTNCEIRQGVFLDHIEPHHAALLDVRETNLNRWGTWYSHRKYEDGPTEYGLTDAYRLGAEWLKNCDTVEDWGCGLGGFRRHVIDHVKRGDYLGIDGTLSPFTNVVADLCYRTSSPEGIYMRGVIEHDRRWKQLLERAILSFRRRMCLVLFTPEVDETKEIAFNDELGVPDIAFSPEDLEPFFKGLKVRKEYIKSHTAYGGETIYYLEKLENGLQELQPNS